MLRLFTRKTRGANTRGTNDKDVEDPTLTEKEVKGKQEEQHKLEREKVQKEKIAAEKLRQWRENKRIDRKPSKWDSFANDLLAYLSARDLCKLAQVSVDFNILVEDNNVVWQKLCEREGYNVKVKLPSHTWVDVYKQMKKHNEDMKEEAARYQKRYEAWREMMSGVACGMRASPPQPLLKKLDPSAKLGELPAGFKVHPNSQVQRVLKFSVDLVQVAKMLLDMLLAARKYDEFHNDSFLAKAMVRYVNFLHLKHKYKNIALIPTLEIEYVWVSHMLRPSMYIKDCTELFGEVIDHDIMLTSSYQCMNKANSLKETAELYKKEFNAPYCEDSLIDSLYNLPHYNISGISPLYPPVEPEKPDEGAYFRQPHEAKSVERGYAFVGELGDVDDTKSANVPIGLKVNDLRMDEMWLGEFNTYMKGAVEDPLATNQILTGTSGYSNPSKMGTKEVYFYIWKAYEKFLFMAAKYPPEKGKYIHPSYAIDVIWHAHMICPKIYAKEVNEWVGYLVDHEPWPTCKKSDMNKAIDKTGDLWKKEFGNKLDVEHVTRVTNNDYDDYYQWGD